MQATETTSRAPIATIIGISVVATLFLLWLVYVHPPSQEYASRLLFLPALNALFNAMSAAALVIGYSYIRKRNIAAHRASMLTAFAFSSLFLVSYITNHALHGEMRFRRTWPDPYCISRAAHQPCAVVGRSVADGAHHIFPFALRPVSTT